MNWDAIGAVGEIIGAAAVVVTLAYLALQVRPSTKDAANSGPCVAYARATTRPTLVLVSVLRCSLEMQ